MQFKYDHDESQFRKVDLTKDTVRKRRKSSLKDVDEETKMRARRKYEVPPGITQVKKDDLLTLCKKNLINPQYHSFYENLIVNKSIKDNEKVVTEK